MTGTGAVVGALIIGVVLGFLAGAYAGDALDFGRRAMATIRYLFLWGLALVGGGTVLWWLANIYAK